MGTYYTKTGKEVVDGDIAQAADLNAINDSVDTGFAQVDAAIILATSNLDFYSDLAEQWATEVENTPVTVGKYSALHYAAKSSASATLSLGYSSDSQGYSVTALGYANDAEASKNATAALVQTKDSSGGIPGLTLLKINFMNALGTIKSFFTNANTVARTYTFQNRDGTIADDTDLALKANLASPTFTGTPAAPTGSSGVYTTQIATQAFVDNYTKNDNRAGTQNNGIGNGSLGSNTGNYCVGIGSYSLRYNDQESCVGIGASALEGGTTGPDCVAIGRGALSFAVGDRCTSIGSYSQYLNDGSDNIGVGYYSLSQNCGVNCVGLGARTLARNNSSSVIEIGHQSTNSFIDNTGAAYPFTHDDVNPTTDSITLLGHGFAPIGQFVHLKFKTVSGTPPAPFVHDQTYRMYVSEEHLLYYPNITSAGSGSFSFTPPVNVDNSVAIGVDTHATKANQVILGDSSVVETLLRGKVILGAQHTPSSAAATGVTGTVCSDASYIYVCTATNTWKRAPIATW